MTTTPNRNIPYVPEGTLDPAAGLNLALNFVDALLQTAVISMDLTAPPVSPLDGDMYIVGDSATGEWAAQDGNLARYVEEGESWQFFEAGTEVALIFNSADNGLYVYEGSAGWTLAAGLGDAPSDGDTYGRRNGEWVVTEGNAAPIVIQMSASDLTSDLVALTSAAYCRAAQAMTLNEVRASLIDASSSGAVTIDINVNSETILSTKLTIDADELTSTTAATPAVISDPDIADDDAITIDIDGAGADAKGLIVTLIGTPVTGSP